MDGWGGSLTGIHSLLLEGHKGWIQEGQEIYARTAFKVSIQT